MGGKTSADNQQVVDEQKAQAKDATAKETARQTRLTNGLARIKAAFEGTPITAPASHAYDWSKVTNKTKPPKGFTFVQVGADGKAVPDNPAQAATPAGGSLDPWEEASGRGAGTASLTPGRAAVAATPATGAGITRALRGPDGKIYRQGQKFNYTSNDPTGKTKGGFDDDFYNKYRNSITDYYDPQATRQYQDAVDKLTFDAARSGTKDSSATDAQIARLAGQNSDNLAGIANKADQAVTAKKADVQTQEKSAINQLYATENPDVAANQATAAVRDISLASPDLSPLSQLFNAVTVGGAKLANAYGNQALISNFRAGIAPTNNAGRIVST